MKMTKFIILFSIIAVVAVLAGEKETVDLKIDGMTCNGCVHAVKAAIEKVDGVTEADVVLASNSAKVTYETDKADAAKIAQAVNKTGFKVVDNQCPAVKTCDKDCCKESQGECCKAKAQK